MISHNRRQPNLQQTLGTKSGTVHAPGQEVQEAIYAARRCRQISNITVRREQTGSLVDCHVTT